MDYSDRIWDAEACVRILEELRPALGNHGWAIALSRFAEPRGGGVLKWTESLLKRAFNRSKPLFTFEDDGLTFVGDRRDRYSRWISGTPGHEAALANRITAHLPEESAYVDIGANMGVLAGFVARAHPGRVIAVEPDRATARRAAAGFALNGQRLATVVCAAAGDAVGEATFHVSAGRSDASSLHSGLIGRDSIPTVVPMITVDQLVKSLVIDRIGFLKIDVEGYEPEVIEGALGTIRAHRPSILFEYHWDIAPRLGWKAEAIKARIETVAEYTFHVLGEGFVLAPFPPDRSLGLVQNVLATPVA